MTWRKSIDYSLILFIHILTQFLNQTNWIMFKKWIIVYIHPGSIIMCISIYCAMEEQCCLSWFSSSLTKYDPGQKCPGAKVHCIFSASELVLCQFCTASPYPTFLGCLWHFISKLHLIFIVSSSFWYLLHSRRHIAYYSINVLSGKTSDFTQFSDT
jgi:hypothetical protein